MSDQAHAPSHDDDQLGLDNNLQLVSGHELWEQVRGSVREHIGEPSFAFIETAVFTDVQWRTVMLAVMSDVARDVILRRLDVLGEVTSKQLGRPVKVEVVVDRTLQSAIVLDHPSDADECSYSVEVARDSSDGRRVLGRMENNLARKGIFDLQGGASERSGEVVRVDLVGQTALQYTMGRLGALEMDTFTWVLGRWRRGEKRLSFSKRELARDLDKDWGGRTGTELTEALMRLRRTAIKGEVWLAQEKRHVTRDVSLIQELVIDEKRESRHGRAIESSVQVVLADWLNDQLERGQYADLDFVKYRKGLTLPFARRLFHILECEEGQDEGTRSEFRVDKQFMATMGSRDTNPSRFRTRLEDAGAQICKIHDLYESITLEYDTRLRYWCLKTRRSPEWKRQRIAQRREDLNREPRRVEAQTMVDVVGRAIETHAAAAS